MRQSRALSSMVDTWMIFSVDSVVEETWTVMLLEYGVSI